MRGFPEPELVATIRRRAREALVRLTLLPEPD